MPSPHLKNSSSFNSPSLHFHSNCSEQPTKRNPLNLSAKQCFKNFTHSRNSLRSKKSGQPVWSRLGPAKTKWKSGNFKTNSKRKTNWFLSWAKRNFKLKRKTSTCTFKWWKSWAKCKKLKKAAKDSETLPDSASITTQLILAYNYFGR